MIDAGVSRCLPVLVGLGRAVPKEELGSESLLESVLVEVVCKCDIEDNLSACNEAENLVIALTANLGAVDYIADVD